MKDVELEKKIVFVLFLVSFFFFLIIFFFEEGCLFVLCPLPYFPLPRRHFPLCFCASLSYLSLLEVLCVVVAVVTDFFVCVCFFFFTFRVVSFHLT